MPDEEIQGTPPADGADPAAPPTAPTEPEKTPEQLAAEKQTADEAAAKQKEADDAEEAAVKKKPWFQKRIDEITRQKHDADRRAERLERMVEQLVQQGKPQPAPATPEKPPEFIPTRPRPTREQFDFDEDKYIDAVSDWKAEQRDLAKAHEQRATEQKTQQERFQTEIRTRTATVFQQGSQKYPDFEAVVSAIPGNVMNPELALCVLETDTPAEIAYHLGKNPAEAERISKLPPLKKAIELGKIETAILQASKRTTQAPPPPAPVGGKGAATVREDELSMDEWLKRREAGQITGHG